ncbi:hypothetical protein BV881_32910 [Streptomyces sp. ZL-24]|uniref:hypothetical protein n=1 Tax=Streptomyces sp. ZL-24 TaxID=1933029 RepID=UPI000CD41746|nr:hypothetical protein [Streptomyces sp. ZL-24]POG43245.1 hypothetical protein BV881_32910 [Streptomyces sp. ZL-24]
MITIDDLLEDAALPITPDTSFDVGAMLRRLAADADRRPDNGGEVGSAAQAGHRLSTVCRWMINAPGAAQHIGELADAPLPETPEKTEVFDVEGACVFACLLLLTGHPESAQFWWQLSAGAGHRIAAYCLHLHHLALGETREAAHWKHEVTNTRTGMHGIDDVLLECLGTVASYVRKNGSSSSMAPTGQLEMEVDRLAVEGGCPIVRRPDQRLVEQLRDFTNR